MLYTADSAEIGICSGISEACAIASYAMETWSVPLSHVYTLIVLTHIHG